MSEWERPLGRDLPFCNPPDAGCLWRKAAGIGKTTNAKRDFVVATALAQVAATALMPLAALTGAKVLMTLKELMAKMAAVALEAVGATGADSRCEAVSANAATRVCRKLLRHLLWGW